MLFAIASFSLAAAVTTAAPQATPTSPEGATKVELVLASAVVNRQAQPLPEKILAGQTVYSFTQVTGPGGGFIEHVWSYNGKEVSRQYLPLGQSKRWRTWSKHKVAAAGQYHVQVLGQDGSHLGEASFEVLPADRP